MATEEGGQRPLSHLEEEFLLADVRWYTGFLCCMLSLTNYSYLQNEFTDFHKPPSHLKTGSFDVKALTGIIWLREKDSAAGFEVHFVIIFLILKVSNLLSYSSLASLCR